MLVLHDKVRLRILVAAEFQSVGLLANAPSGLVLYHLREHSLDTLGGILHMGKNNHSPTIGMTEVLHPFLIAFRQRTASPLTGFKDNKTDRLLMNTHIFQLCKDKTLGVVQREGLHLASHLVLYLIEHDEGKRWVFHSTYAEYHVHHILVHLVRILCLQVLFDICLDASAPDNLFQLYVMLCTPCGHQHLPHWTVVDDYLLTLSWASLASDGVVPFEYLPVPS